MCVFFKVRVHYTPSPLLLSESSSQVYVFNILSTVTELIGFWGELLALGLLCRCFCLGSSELKCDL